MSESSAHASNPERPADELSGRLRKAVEQVNAVPAPRQAAARVIERAAAWSAATAAPVARPPVRRLPIWAVATLAAAALVVFSLGGIILWAVLMPTPEGYSPYTPVTSVKPTPPEKPDSMPMAKDKPGIKVPAVKVVRLPAGATYPKAIYRTGVLHVVYFMGDPKQGDVYYLRWSMGPIDFSKAVRVNSQPRSVYVAGPGSGPQLAVDDHSIYKVHVAWAGPPGSGAGTGNAVYYTHFDEKKSAFEPQQEVRGKADGIATAPAVASNAGYAWVFWTAPGQKDKPEAGPHLWMAKS